MNKATAIESSPAWLNQPVQDVNLVLEGGAMRCLFTQGVLDCLMLKRLFAKRVIGVSAGALSGWYYVMGLVGRACYINVKYCTDWRYLSLKSFLVTGNACGREYMFDKVPRELEPVDFSLFNDSPIQLVAVSSNIETGEADYHALKDADADMPYLIATSSMPLVSQIVNVDGKLLLDGGTCDSVPIDYSLKTGARKHIVVTTHDANYVRKPERALPLMERVYKDYPYYLDRARYRHYEYNRTYREIQRMHARGEAFVIMPPEPVTVSNMETDPKKLMALYEQGYKTALEAWPALEAYLSA